MDSTGSLPVEKQLGEQVMTAASGNQGFAKRHQFIQDGKKFTLSGPVFVDAFMGSRLLLNMVNLKLILNRNSDKFCLMDKNDPFLMQK